MHTLARRAPFVTTGTILLLGIACLSGCGVPTDLGGIPAPAFSPMTVRPVLTNAEEVREVLLREYPAVLRDAGIEGAPIVWLYIGSTGAVEATRIHQSSAYEGLDQAAQTVASAMRFRPAQNGDEAVAVWVQIPIQFRVVN